MRRCPIFFAVLALTCTRAPALDEEALPTSQVNAVNQGAAFLASQQDWDGSFDGGSPSRVGTTSRAMLAWLGAGHVPDTGRYGDNVRRAEEWLLSQQAPDGWFGLSGERGMRGQGWATLALAEVYGVDGNVDRRSRIYSALEKVLPAILAAQKVAKSHAAMVGGWNADHNAPDSTLTITAIQLMALRACRDIGLQVPAESLQSAAGFVLRCHDGQSGGFAPAPGTPAQISTTAAGILCFEVLGLGSQHAAEIDAAVKYLSGHPIDGGNAIGYASMDFVTLCSLAAGGSAWSGIGRAVIERLMRMQEKDGGWPQVRARAGGAPLNRTAATAAALQALTVPYQLLPIYQR